MNHNSLFRTAFTGLALVALLCPAAVRGDLIIPAGADAFATAPNGFTSITLPAALGGQVVSLEGASGDYGNRGLLTQTDVNNLNRLAPGLLAPVISVVWKDPHGAVVGPQAFHAVPWVFAHPFGAGNPANFDTVVKRTTQLDFTAAGQVEETQIKIIMLDLQNITPVLIRGFHYNILVTLQNGIVYDGVDPEYFGNAKFDLDFLAPGDTAGAGRVDLGVTGPTPGNGNLGADLPSGMEGLPVNFDLNFIPLDGGPAIGPVSDESILQNPSYGSWSDPPAPEPSSLTLLSLGALGLVVGFRRRGLANGRLRRDCSDGDETQVR